MGKIKQLNENNNTGFEHKTGTDIGLDEDGNVALGYQHHDALWWNGTTTVEAKRPASLELHATVEYFHNLFGRIAYNLLTTFKPVSVLDLGCGSGMLCSKMRQLNSNVLTTTVDANQLVKEKSPYINENHFTARTDKKLDFRNENNHRLKFDMVVSLEHFEHVSEETFDTLMENIVEHTRKGSILVFTAASWAYDIEEQEHVHCHIKSTEEWVKYVQSYGFEILDPPFALNRAGDTAEIFTRRMR